MVTRKKILWSVLGFLGISLILLTCVVLFWLGPAVKGIATYLVPKAIGTPVSIKRLSINPRQGTVELSGFVLRNQDEFGRTNAVSLGGVNMDIDLGSLFSSTVIVHRVLIDSPVLTYEMSQASDNVMSFLRDFEQFARVDVNEQISELSNKQDDAKDAPVVILESLQITNMTFHLANQGNAELDMDVTIENLEASMTNGLVVVSGFSISNPGRLNQPNLFTIDQVRTRLNPETLYTEKVLVKDVEVTRPHLFLELNDRTDTMAELIRIRDRFLQRLIADPPPEALVTLLKEAMVIPEEGLPVELDKVVINDLCVQLSLSGLQDIPAASMTLFGIKRIEAQMMAGLISIQDVELANPPGFSVPHLLDVQEVAIRFKPDTLFDARFVVSQVQVINPTVNLEQVERGGNVAMFQALGMKLASSALPQEEQTARPAVEPLQSDELPVDLGVFLVTNLVVNLVLPEEQREDAALDGYGRIAIVTFRELTSSLAEGRIVLHDLKVANPVGFANPHLVTIEEFSLDVDLDTLTSDVLYMEEITIERPRIAYERQIRTDNIQALQQEMESKMELRDIQLDAAGEKLDVARAEKERQKVAIGTFSLRKGLVKIKLSLLPSAPIPLPPIRLREIGDRNRGANVEDALAEIGNTVYAAILGSVSSTTGYAENAVRNSALVHSLTLVAVPPQLEEMDATSGTEVGKSDSASDKRRGRRGAGGRRRIL